jgi:hypothetical protein
VRVEAVDLVDDGHGREGGIVGAGEQVPRRRELAPLRYPQGQGVEDDDLGLVIAGQAGGHVDSVITALAGGLITGTILGAVQAWGLGRSGPGAIRWIAATAIGLTIGLGIGATGVGFRTSLAAVTSSSAPDRSAAWWPRGSSAWAPT